MNLNFIRGLSSTRWCLPDEINRSTPKAQSALLEAMEEQQVTVEGVTYQLPQPFFVIATQNPSHQIGTFPLPESQLDRFLMRIELGYPAPEYERQLLTGQNRHQLIESLEPQILPGDLQTLAECGQEHTCLKSPAGLLSVYY